LSPCWAKLPQQETDPERQEERGAHGGHDTQYNDIGGGPQIGWGRTLGLGAQEGPWENEFITVAFKESSKIQKAKSKDPEGKA